MTKSYTELSGGKGKSILHRPRRFLSKEIASSIVRIEINGEPYPVRDIAINSFSVDVVDKSVTPFFSPTSECKIYSSNRSEIFSGICQLEREETVSSGTRYGFSLSDGYIDIEKVRLSFQEEKLLSSANSTFTEQIFNKVPISYVEKLTRLSFSLKSIELSVNRFHSDREPGPEVDPDRCDILAEELAKKIRPVWHEFDRYANENLHLFTQSEEIHHAIKIFTERMLTHQLTSCPGIWRSYSKPFGYPGDFLIMNYIYGNGYEGTDVFSKAIHKISVETRICEAVRHRKELLKEIISNELIKIEGTQASISETPSRVLSLGCGGAQEVTELCVDSKFSQAFGHVEWTLVDQEDRALTYAQNNIMRAILTGRSRWRINCLYASFLQLVSDKRTAAITKDRQHILYSSGLFDYLKQNRAKRLTRKLFDQVAPGGILVIANLASPSDYRWQTDYLLDWEMIYRTEKEMENLTADLPHVESAKIVKETKTAAVYFLIVRKSSD